MATYYLDPSGGNDANDGTTFANRWQTITSGATTARIAAGDTIRVMASPVPTSVGNATWTNGSRTITLAAACTANIDRGESAWTASANVTCAADTGTYKEGAGSASQAIAAGFTTGLVAYKATGTLDLSSYQQVSFWVRANAAVAASTLTLDLCTDTVGATSVHTIPVPALQQNVWTPVTVDTGGALNSAIASVSLNALLDPGTVTVFLDNILACKAPSAADSLTLHSAIGKNLTTENFFGVQSINGTAVILANDPAQLPGATRAYAGTTETVTTYKRECFVLTPAATSTTVMNAINDSGTSGSPITFSGGWDRTDMSTRLTGTSGQSWFDAQIGSGYLFEIGTRSFIEWDGICGMRANVGFRTSGGGATQGWVNLTDVTMTGCLTGVECYISPMSLTRVYACANRTFNLICHQVGELCLKDCLTDMGLSSTAGAVFSECATVRGQGIKSRNNSTHGVGAYTGARVQIRDLVTAGNSTAAIIHASTSAHAYIDLTNSSLGESTELVALTGRKHEGYVRSQDHDQVSGTHRIIMHGGQINTDTSVVHGTSTVSWRFSPTDSARDSQWPMRLTLARVAVVSGSLVTVTAWVRRSSTSAAIRLVIPRFQLLSMDSDETATIAAAADTWEQLTVTTTPAEAGVIEIEAHAYGGTTHNLYIGDMEITQA